MPPNQTHIAQLLMCLLFLNDMAFAAESSVCVAKPTESKATKKPVAVDRSGRNRKGNTSYCGRDFYRKKWLMASSRIEVLKSRKESLTFHPRLLSIWMPASTMKLILIFSLFLSGCGGSSSSSSTANQTLAVPDSISTPECGAETTYVSGESADFVSMVVPAAMSSGKSYPVSVTFCNNGTTTWNYQVIPSSGNGIGALPYYRLSALNPVDNQIWGISRVELIPGDSVSPGHVKTFSFSVVAPLNTSGVGVENNFQWGITKGNSGNLGISPNVRVTSFHTPAFLIQNPPKIPPAPVSPDDFNFENFQGANMIYESYSQAGNNHRSWFPDVIQMNKIISQAAAMHLKYLRMPVIIPPDAESVEYVASEWYTPAPGTGVNANNVNNVVGATQSVLDIALRNGLKVILVLDGYTEYDAECTSGEPGLKFWKKSFNSVKSNAATIVQAASKHPALYAWDILNEPLWNASAYGCLSVSPNAFGRGTQSPRISLAQASTATEESIIEVVEAVHAMYNLVRANDAYSHPTTVGEGQLPFMHYWNDISSFASPHLYISPKAIIDAQVQANNGHAPQIVSFTGAPADNSKWKLTDELLQKQIPMIASATTNAMKREATENGVQLPFMIGEYGISYLDQVPTPEDQAVYYSLLGATLKKSNTGSMLWDLSTGPQGGSNFSLLATDGSFLPAACVVAKNISSTPAGC